jgi:hypothetical protein
VVNPNLPPDYEPKICMECYERTEKPKQAEFMMKLFAGLSDISDKLKSVARSFGGASAGSRINTRARCATSLAALYKTLNIDC